jgi:hypothetical protein
MKILLAAVILSLATPAMGSSREEEYTLSALVTHCLRRLTGSTNDSSLCERTYARVADSADRIAESQPVKPVETKDANSECSGYSYEFGLEYIPVYYGKSRMKACVPMEQVPALLEATRPYSKTRY